MLSSQHKVKSPDHYHVVHLLKKLLEALERDEGDAGFLPTANGGNAACPVSIRALAYQEVTAWWYSEMHMPAMRALAWLVFTQLYWTFTGTAAIKHTDFPLGENNGTRAFFSCDPNLDSCRQTAPSFFMVLRHEMRDALPERYY
jgi:hypothetical protein